jgi:hypothetical protein
VLAVAATVVAAWSSLGCGSSLLVPDGGGGGGAGGRDAGADAPVDAPLDPTARGFLVFSEVLNRKLDLVFLVDDSSSMELAQENLRANIPRFMDVLKTLPDGMPDMHIAVVSSDLGVGHNHIPGCNSTGGNNGVFRSGVGVGAIGCTATGLNPGATYLTTTGGAAPQNNFTGDITNVLQCILPIGASGCGFERQLASLARALGADGSPAPAENTGFLRPEAYLGIVLVTDEDDCSARDTAVYDVLNNTDLASPMGPPGNFRCSEFGHLCDGAPPRRLAPNGQVTDLITYQNCVSSESAGLLVPVSQFAAGIKALKADSSLIVVTSIQGPVTPYQIRWKQPSIQTDGPWPEIVHSCTSAPGGGFADPGVRLLQFTQGFGRNGLVYSVCQDNFGPSLNTVAMKLAQTMNGVPCVPGPFVDEDGDPGNGVQPKCTVLDHVPQGGGGAAVETAVRSCEDSGGDTPCWALAPSNECASGQSRLTVNRGGTAVIAPGQLLLVKCDKP